MTYPFPSQPRKAKVRPESVAVGCIAVVIAATLKAVIGGWFLMLLLGVTHAELAWPAHGVGYLPCIPIAFLLGLVFGRSGRG